MLVALTVCPQSSTDMSGGYPMNPWLSCCLLTRLCCGIGVITDVVSRLASQNLGLGAWSSLRSCAPGTDNDYGIREIRKAYSNIHGGKGENSRIKISSFKTARRTSSVLSEPPRAC